MADAMKRISGDYNSLATTAAAASNAPTKESTPDGNASADTGTGASGGGAGGADAAVSTPTTVEEVKSPSSAGGESVSTEDLLMQQLAQMKLDFENKMAEERERTKQVRLKLQAVKSDQKLVSDQENAARAAAAAAVASTDSTAAAITQAIDNGAGALRAATASAELNERQARLKQEVEHVKQAMLQRRNVIESDTDSGGDDD